MAGRPRDWSPVADNDPIPGDPDRIANLGKTLRKTADELERQIKNIKAVSEVEAWESKAGKEFKEKAQGNVKKLEAAFKRYDAAADALGKEVTEVGGRFEDLLHAKPKNYASDLNRAQEMAALALKDAQDAEGRKSANQKSLDALSDKGGKDKDSKESKEEKKKLEEARDGAGDEIEAARAKIGQAQKVRDDAAKRARDAIEDVIADDSLKDGFWETLVDDIKGITEMISTVCGILSLVVGWIPVIGQALAGVLGAIAMIATLITTICTIIQVFQGNADWMDVGLAAVGFLLMGVGKAFSKVAGKFAKSALKRMGKAGAARTTKQVTRANKNLRKLSGQKFKLQKGEGWKSLKEPFTEPFSKAAWGKNLKTLKPGEGNWAAARNELAERGGGSAFKGIPKSFSMADPGVASDLKGIKAGMSGLGGRFDMNAVSQVSATATRLGVTGAGITLAGLGLDGNLNPLVA
ncbi:hypothetical protein ACIBKX_13600 [Streptomyces sp. NPDC050658]|uniref:hypothetical protein n=1 Tax=unclassified Streptomyces TaxID=2593676 RepID=UPI0034228B73